MALIVVVDDEVFLANLLADLLIDDGHEIVTASHGRAALQVIRERKPALVITDFMMPLMTGLELAQALNAEEDLKAIPVILVSGAQAGIARQNDNLFVAVFDKPYNLQAMIDTVRMIVTVAGP